MKMEALHDFHNKIYAEEWARKFHPTLDRMLLFETIWDEINYNARKFFHILELGIGPGFLAFHLLMQVAKISYEELDFSEPMLKLASE